MRKLFAMLLVLALSVCGAAAAEVSIDLSAMSLDELVELHNHVDAELYARIACEPSVFPAGMYVAGESIKAGSYTISGSDEHYGFKVATFASKEIYEQAMAENNEALMTFGAYVSKTDSVFVHLEEGMVLVVSGTSLIESANAEWMP